LSAWHCTLSAKFTKTHSFRLFFGDFPAGIVRTSSRANRTRNPNDSYRRQRWKFELRKRPIFRIWGTDFWKSTKSLFSKRSQNHEKVFLHDDANNLTENENDIAENWYDYFVNVTSLYILNKLHRLKCIWSVSRSF